MSVNPPAYASFRPQFDFVKDEDDQIGVDSIFLYEHIDEFAEYMSEKIGESLTVSYRNPSPVQANAGRVQALVDFAKRRVIRTVGANRFRSGENFADELSPALLADLKEFMRRDFQMYERVKNKEFRQ